MNETSAMSLASYIRIAILLFGLIWIGWIIWSSKRKKSQGIRVGKSNLERVEPQLGDASIATRDDFDPAMREELEKLSDEIVAQREPLSDTSNRVSPHSSIGARQDANFERIVTLYVVARQGHVFAASDLVVALEKAGLHFGDMGIFHRTVDGRSDTGPIFSVANMIKPGRFDMSNLNESETPGVSLFMTLPGPLSALDAWDAMLPTAQRLAELLDAEVLDEDRNALGRQRIQYLRDELRAFDRQQDKNTIKSFR